MIEFDWDSIKVERLQPARPGQTRRACPRLACHHIRSIEPVLGGADR